MSAINIINFQNSPSLFFWSGDGFFSLHLRARLLLYISYCIRIRHPTHSVWSNSAGNPVSGRILVVRAWSTKSTYCKVKEVQRVPVYQYRVHSRVHSRVQSEYRLQSSTVVQFTEYSFTYRQLQIPDTERVRGIR